MGRYNMRERAREIVSQRGLGGMANNTKWGEFFAEIQAHVIPLEFKLIDQEDAVLCSNIWCPVSTYVEGGSMGPYPFYWVEWVRTTEVSEVTTLAKAVGLECVVEDGKAIVYGYR